VSEWASKFGREFARHIRSRSKGGFADKWHLDEMVVTIKGKNTAFGGQSTRKVMFLMTFCKAAGTRRPLVE
jgi:hypothetical protein